jgi:solute carrier family 25 iron transporter 28/37
VFGLYRGVTAVILDAIPSHAAYFAAYEASKKVLQKGSENVTPFVSGVSGVVATFAHDAISTPVRNSSVLLIY